MCKSVYCYDPQRSARAKSRKLRMESEIHRHARKKHVDGPSSQAASGRERLSSPLLRPAVALGSVGKWERASESQAGLGFKV